jgi:hypothetical protein
MIAKRIFLILMLPLFVASLLTAWAPQNTSAETFNGNLVMDDAVFGNYGSMNAAQIDAFLNGFTASCISPNSGFSAVDPTGYNPTQGFLYGGNVSAGTVIFHAAQVYDINPQVLIATLQKEQSLITGDAGCTTNRIAKSLGYGCPDGGSSYSYDNVNLYTRNGTTFTTVSGVCVNSAAKAGFTQQIIHAAWMLKYSQQRSLGNINWAVIEGSWDNSDDLNATFSGYMTQGCFKRSKYESSCTFYDGWTTIDGTATHIDSGATAALYRYTPHFSGNRNFDTIFNNWFGSVHARYTSLDDPRWMVLATDAQKFNPATGIATSGTFPAGTQLQLVDKLNVDGTWFLRTAYDSAHNINQGIRLSSLGDITPVALENPRYMQITTDRVKWDPINGSVDNSVVYPAGMDFNFVDKVSINGSWYYRTKADRDANKKLFFTATAISDIPFLAFDTPRYMETSKDTHFVNPSNGTPGASVAANTQILFDTKMLVHGMWHFRSAEDTANANPVAIPSTDIREVPYQDLTPAHKWMQLAQNTDRYNPATQKMVAGQYIENAVHPQILLSQKISINGTLYYRTDWDRTHNKNLGIPASYLTDIPFVSLESPRTVKLKSYSAKVNPFTGESYGTTFPPGYELPYATKVYVNGEWYLRTQSDTSNNLPYGMPLSSLAT